jgi:hypothetical protein
MMVFDFTLPPDHPWNNKVTTALLGKKFNASYTNEGEQIYETVVIGVCRLPIEFNGATVLRLEAR